MTAAGVRAARERLGTQREVAALLGVHITALQRWESGERAVSGPAARLLLSIERVPGVAALLRGLV